MKEDILDFFVRFISYNSTDSAVFDYFKDLEKSNPDLLDKIMDEIYSLPQNLYLYRNIKTIKIENYKLYELRIRDKNNISRILFIVDKPNLVILHAFTKKTQKIEKKDLGNAIENLKYYQKHKTIVGFKDE